MHQSSFFPFKGLSKAILSDGFPESGIQVIDYLSEELGGEAGEGRHGVLTEVKTNGNQ